MSSFLRRHDSRATRRRSGGSTGILRQFGRRFRSRLAKAAGSWPVALRNSLGRYLTHPTRSGVLRPLRRGPDAGKPYWLLLPCWLMQSREGKRPATAAGRAFLDDVLSAQYFLFLAVRIRDDLHDGQWNDRSISAAAELLEMEAETALSRHFPPHDPLWRFYRGRLRSTALGIARVDALQRSKPSRLTELLAAYSRVNALFCIAPAAVCRRTGWLRGLAAARRFSDQFSAAAQILDDITDIREDLDRGRMNYAAAVAIAAARRRSRARRPLRLVEEGLTANRAGISLLEEASRRFEDAFRAIAPLRSPAAEAYAAGCRRAMAIAKVEMLRTVIFSHSPRVNGGGTRGAGGTR